jgi:hypothetical protein
MAQKIAGHHSGIRTANITNKLNISIEIYFKKSLECLKFGVSKVGKNEN